MKTIQISDLTLRLNETQKSPVSSFREKVEIMKEMDRLCVDVIETTCRKEQKADALLLHTAAPLLRHSALPVGTVATSAGFEDPFYFSRVFRREMGVSPTEYRAGRP